MKSRVAPKVVWRRRGEEGGDSRPSPAFTTPDWPPSAAAPSPSVSAVRHPTEVSPIQLDKRSMSTHSQGTR